MISFPIGISGQTLHFTDEVLLHVSAHRQTKLWHREAGGLLFARIEGASITIEDITGPRRDDRRSRCSYEGDREAEQEEIYNRHRLGLEYVGDWHTHPQRRPKPSGIDDRTMSSRVQESRHQLLGFVFVIVGTDKFPAGLTVLVHDGFKRYSLTPMPDSLTALSA